MMARVVGGDLLITGTGHDDVLTIERSGARAGDVHLRQNLGENGPTWHTFTGVTGDIRIDLGGGDDQVVVRDVRVGRDLRINSGAGDDHVSLIGTRVRRNVAIKARVGVDGVAVVGVTTGNQVRVAAGSGNDRVTLNDSTFNGKAYVKGWRGDDSVALAGSTFRARRFLNDGMGKDAIYRTAVEHTYDFGTGDNGWVGGASDFHAGLTAEIDAKAEIRQLPAEVGAGTAYYLSGNNFHADDLLVFLKRQLGPDDGIQPNQSYVAVYDVMVASNYADTKLYLQVGGGATEPVPVLDDQNYWGMNVDVADQANNGRYASIAGVVSNDLSPGESLELGEPYLSVRRRHVHPAPIRADADGRLWLFLGIDSAVESTVPSYLQSVKVTLVPTAG